MKELQEFLTVGDLIEKLKAFDKNTILLEEDDTFVLYWLAENLDYLTEINIVKYPNGTYKSTAFRESKKKTKLKGLVIY